MEVSNYGFSQRGVRRGSTEISARLTTGLTSAPVRPHGFAEGKIGALVAGLKRDVDELHMQEPGDSSDGSPISGNRRSSSHSQTTVGFESENETPLLESGDESDIDPFERLIHSPLGHKRDLEEGSDCEAHSCYGSYEGQDSYWQYESDVSANALFEDWEYFCDDEADRASLTSKDTLKAGQDSSETSPWNWASASNQEKVGYINWRLLVTRGNAPLATGGEGEPSAAQMFGFVRVQAMFGVRAGDMISFDGESSEKVSKVESLRFQRGPLTRETPVLKVNGVSVPFDLACAIAFDGVSL